MSVRILQGDVRARLAEMPADVFDCIVTSPPYWGLRDYGVDGQIGLEPTLTEYLETMVAVCRELRRVLKPSGTFWLNIGDSYSGGGRGGNPEGSPYIKQRSNVGSIGNVGAPTQSATGLRAKNLCMVPNRLAIRLQDDGWYVRSEIIWHKSNPMPESVTDRPTNAHEKIWLLTKSERYYYDAEAIAEPVTGGAHARKPGPNSLARIDRVPVSRKVPAVTPKSAEPGLGIKANTSFHAATGDLVEMRNARTVWAMGSEPFSEAHFATFPPELAERCIKAGCPADGHVLDPFGGAGTTGMVADRLGRDATLIELNPAYVEIARNRLTQDAGMFAELEGA